jgi:Ni,Fe-hydrogenase III component G
MKADEVVNIIREHVKESEIISGHRVTAVTDRQRYRDALTVLKKRDILHLSTISGVDLGREIAIVYHIDCGGVLLNLKLTVPKRAPRLLTITDIFPGAILYERELMDMLGVEIQGHPDPRRLFLPEDWPADKYPLRKGVEVSK